MQYPAGIVLLVLFLLAAGCVSPSPAPAEVAATPVPTAIPTTDNPRATVPSSDMALQASDLPAEYVLRDRSVMTSPEVSQLTRDLGWLQGYFVTFDRTGRTRSDHTRIRQSISIFPVENMKKIFNIEKAAFEGQESMMSSPYEVPFPTIGDRSIAYRMTDIPETGQVTYTVIFTKKNVFERITMAGTSTDYEVLRDLAENAAAKIR